MTTLQVYIADVLDHQLAEDRSPARFKLFHHGRRWGKDRVAFKGAICGHGPDTKDGPLFPGAVQGWWVGWVVRDFTQGLGIWREEFLPRFKDLQPVVSVNRSELRVELPNGGGIFMCTAENINSLRGLGKKMRGLVVNEAAHFDLEAAWGDVLRAVLVDNKGWAIIMSTPNSGDDGNPTGRTPSYFNLLCLQAKSGGLGEEWAVFEGDCRTNPKIDPKEALAFIRELGEGSQRQAEEGYGRLIQSGAGLAFPAWEPKIHLAPWQTVPEDYGLILGMDWGISRDNLSAVVAFRIGPKKTLLGIREWTWTGQDAYEAGYDFGNDLMSADLPRWPEWFVADSAMNERTGVGGSTILSEFQSGINDALKPFRTPPLSVVGAPKGPGSRRKMFNDITKYLAWGPALENGTVPASRMPLLQIMKDRQGNPTCPVLAKDLATAPKVVGADDVDKDRALFAAGDALGYLLSMVLPAVQVREPDIPQDRHPGWLPTGQLRSRDRSPEVVARERRIVAEYAASRRQQPPGDRYGRSPRRPG